MVLSPICRFDHAFLLLKLLLDTPSLSHAGGKCHRRDGQNGCPRLHGQKRLILGFTSKWAKTTHCPPHRYYGQNESTRGSFALSEAEGGPDHNRAANKSDGVVFS